MTINQFAVQVSRREGKIKQMNIGQIKEVLKVSNDMTGGEFYKTIRALILLQ